MSLRSRLILRLSFGLPVTAALLFLPAGTWRFWQGWTFLAVAFTYAFSAFRYFYKHDRELMERRLRSKEKISEQRRLMRWLKPVFFAVFLPPGFDYRFGWSRTIEVEAGQKVISSGPYALVRHPMYSGSLLIWLSAPLALGSYVAWPAFALLIPFYVYRLFNEERFLRRELPGYSEYCLRTRFRLVPYVW